MEPLSVIALASSIITFIDFTVKVVSGSREIYENTDGLTDENIKLKAVATRVSQLNRRLLVQHRKLEDFSNDRNDAEAIAHAQSLDTILLGCNEIATQMLAELERLRPKADGMRSNICAAIKMVWNQPKLKKLKEQLRTYREEMVLHIIMLVHSNQPALQRSIDSLAADSRQNHLTILQAVKSWPQAPKRTERDEDIISEQLAELTLKQEVERAEQALLDVLESPQLRDRCARIPQAHQNTFQWIFKDDNNETGEDSFSEWLSQGGGIYWITGKAGAGKSTLMKFICQAKQTRELLQSWAGDKTLATASFYFWIAGTSLQKSLHGLLRSLLHGILNVNREIIPRVFPRRWRLHHLYGPIQPEPWTEQEFVDAIKILKSESGRSSRICFFIDGLDEYEGNYQEMTVFLQELSSLPDLKICVSSRPWLPFEDAFGKRPMLRVQDLTMQDITNYARGTLDEEPRWKQVCFREHDKARGLIRDIRLKSDGVFLWVYLVVRSLLQGLQNGDRITDLQSRLDEFPSDLGDFFMHTLSRLEPSYLQGAQRHFRIAIESSEPLLLMTYSFLGEETLDAEFGINAPVKPIPAEDIPPRLEDTERRLRSRCKDLLEVYIEEAAGRAFLKSTAIPRKSPERLQTDSLNIEVYTRVGFLHRTVRDFFDTTEAQIKLAAAEKDGFDGTLWLFQAIIAQVKALSPRARAGTKLTAFKRVVRPALDSLSKFGRYDLPYTELLDEFDRALSHYCQQAKIPSGEDGSPPKHWTAVFFEESMSMLELAAAKGLIAYVRYKLRHYPPHVRSPFPRILECAVDPPAMIGCRKSDGPDEKMVNFLNKAQHSGIPLRLTENNHGVGSDTLQIFGNNPSGDLEALCKKRGSKLNRKHRLDSFGTRRDGERAKRRRCSNRIVDTETS